MKPFRQLTKEQTQVIADYQQLIRLWVKAEIHVAHLTKKQWRVLKNFMKKDIPWVSLTGTK